MTTPVAMDEAVIDNAVILSSWNEWDYAEADWTSFSIASDDFDKLNESLVLAVAVADADDAFQSTGAAFVSATQAVSYNSSPGSVTTSDSTLGEEDDLRLVHLLVAAAEALAGPHKSPELARVILVRLKVLASQGAAASGCGTSIERLAAYFTSALQDMLDGGGRGTLIRDGHRRSVDVITAFQLLQDIFPYVKFGHFTANQAILEVTLGERRVHVVDYDIAEGVQWASFMQALVSRPGPPPPPHLRITAVSRGGSRALQETGRRLAEFAASVGQPFSFSQCRLDTDDCFRPAWVKVVKGEAVVMNCVLHPTMGEERRGSAAGVASFLAGAGTLGARAVVLVEEEDAGEEKESGFVGRFVGELRRYSAVWESLEAGFPMQERTRDVVERVILGPMIASAVGRAYLEARDGTREGGWGRWMAVTGFGRVGISCFNHSQAKLLLGLFSDGYRVAADGCNKLVLEWKAKRLLSASVWSPPPPCVDGYRVAPDGCNNMYRIDVCFDDDSELFKIES